MVNLRLIMKENIQLRVLYQIGIIWKNTFPLSHMVTKYKRTTIPRYSEVNTNDIKQSVPIGIEE